MLPSKPIIAKSVAKPVVAKSAVAKPSIAVTRPSSSPSTLLLCHGRLHERAVPWYWKGGPIDWKNAVTLDIDPFAMRIHRSDHTDFL
jgi:hypothetical protein